MIERLIRNGLFFNDNLKRVITKTRGLSLTDIRNTSYNLAGENFGYHVSSFYSKRRFSIEGWVKGNDAADFMSERNALLSAFDIVEGEELPLSILLVDGRELQIVCTCIGMQFDPDAGITVAAPFQIDLEAAFPYLESVTEVSQTTGLPIGGGGTVPPPTMPMALGGNSGGSVFIHNGGNARSYPNARISGPVTNPSLRNETLGKEISFTITLAAGEYLDVDFKKKTVFDNTGRNRYDTKSGDWWYLEKNTTSEIKFLAASNNPTASVTVKNRDTYLGI